MRALVALLFWMAWWLRKPMLWLVRYRVAPDNLNESLGLDPAKPVCFVLPERSWADLFVLNRICKQYGLPRPRRTGSELPSVEQPGCLYLSALLESRIGQGDLMGLIQRAVADTGYEVQIVPVSIFWGRDPGQETSLFKLLFADTPGAGALRKLFIILANGRNVFASFAKPLSFRQFMGKETDAARALRKLGRLLHVHFLRARTAALGPSLVRRPVVIRGLLNSKAVRLAIEHEAQDKGITIEQAMARARKCAEELAADYTSAAVNFLERLLGYVWNRVFRGVEVRGIERVREWAQSHELLYLPSHRSHADYLLVSYTLYHAGIVPPHIAAGINLNMPVVGGLLRRCGAFFIRRSLSGDRLYTAVFRAYVDSLIQRGYSISFYPEGGRSRTGRLLPPKTGLMSMVVESALRQRVRKVAVVPIYIGYDKVWEINSYLKELRGAKKEAESVQGLLKATRILTKSFGKVYINFGEPILLPQFAEQNLPGWREGFGSDAEPQRPTGYAEAVRVLALETQRRINAAAVANPSALISVAMLASPQKAVAEDDLLYQLTHLVELLRAQPYSADQHVPLTDARAIVDWAAPVAGLSRVPHAWGEVLAADADTAVKMTWYRNNIQHLFALPSLIANFYRTRYRLSEDAVVGGCRALYPFLHTEFFLRWEPEECDRLTRQWIEAMVARKLLARTDGGMLQRPEVETPEFAVLAMLGRIMGETLERYSMTTLLLAQERRRNAEIPRARFEEDCKLLAERLAVLTGRNAPEFFDAGLFRGYINTLIGLKLVAEREDRTLAVDERVERIAERSVNFLGAETQQILLQLLARRRDPGAAAPAPAAG
ncbi:MAG: glycerol-3-phosphate 1-O-acyltransferase PlsB [Gammaproteobacteria bacterium]|nr:glycerol-3-phosphate 1-O-acyltransferase PlsB [Gammaproteobacteria bacterium]